MSDHELERVFDRIATEALKVRKDYVPPVTSLTVARRYGLQDVTEEWKSASDCRAHGEPWGCTRHRMKRLHRRGLILRRQVGKRYEYRLKEAK